MLEAMKKLVFVVTMTILVSACQTAPERSPVRVLDNRTFMGLWSTYQHCMSGQDLDQLRSDVAMLNGAPHSTTSPSDFTVPLPEMLMRHVSVQPTRVSADPKAMVAACSVRASELAVERGRNEVAVELLNGLLRTHSSGEYGYYIQQAKATLQRIQPTALYVNLPGPVGAISQAKPARVVVPPASSSPATEFYE